MSECQNGNQAKPVAVSARSCPWESTRFMYKNYPRGSEWRKWDLHIHSPLSILNNQYPKLDNGEPDWESFLRKVESLDLVVVGITDYFTIEGYKALRNFKDKDRLKNIHTVLPNIEFRLKSVISSKKDGCEFRRLNFHVIFSNEVSIKDIEEHFLHDISFYYEGNPQDRDDVRKLKISNLEELGKKLLLEHRRFRDMGLNPLTVGTMQAVVDHEEITEILSRDSRFRGKYIIILPEELYSLIDWDGQDHHIRKGLLQKSDMVFSSNPKTRQWSLGKEPYTEGKMHFIKEFKTLKPCIHGSDAHTLEDIGHPCALRGTKEHSCKGDPSGCELRYCWIKADPTFEGLKQLLYEPEERVMIQEQNPAPIISNHTISKVGIDETAISDELSIKEIDLGLNTALVAVIGGKGTGKTALVDIIANCYMDRCNTDDRNSFVRRIVDHDPEIVTKLLFKDGNEFSKFLTDQQFIEEGQIVYIAQGELERYIGDESDLDKYINDLIFESPMVKDSVKSFEYTDLIEKVEDIEKQISIKNESIEKLEDKTRSDVASDIEREKKRNLADLKDIEERIKELEKVQSQENIRLAQQKQEQLGALKARKDDLLSLRNLLRAAIDFLDKHLSEFNELIQSINGLLTKLEIKENYEELSYARRVSFARTLEVITKEIAETVSEIEKAQKELNQFELGVKEHAKLLDRKRDINVVLEKLTLASKQFAEKKTLLKQSIEERKRLMRQLFENMVLQEKKYEEIISDFSAKKLDVLADLDFIAKIHFDADGFLKKAEGVMDNRKVNIEGDEKTPPAFDNLIKFCHAVANGDQGKINDLVEEIELYNVESKTKIKSQPITVGDFYALLYDNYMRVMPVVKYKKTNLEKLSLGQKATVLIKIYLAQGDKPIIIDSHDDHLDNEFIMDELVKAIRQAKSYRQVILVSNNGNVVINSDAEQIVIASKDEGKLSYTSGSIENPFIRDQALRVLEGGSEAFRKRQQKYRIGF